MATEESNSWQQPQPPSRPYELAERLQQILHWLLMDMHCKAPEQYAACLPHWLQQVQQALAANRELGKLLRDLPEGFDLRNSSLCEHILKTNATLRERLAEAERERDSHLEAWTKKSALLDKWQGIAGDSERAYKSICTMLGWMNTPPLRMIEGDIAALKERASRADAAEAKVREYRGILLRIASHVTPIQDANNEQQVANDIGETMGKLEELDDIVNSRVCDLECEAAQAQEQVAQLQAKLAVVRSVLEWYGDANRYRYDETCCPYEPNPGAKTHGEDVLSDNGEKARDAVANIVREQPVEAECNHIWNYTGPLGTEPFCNKCKLSKSEAARRMGRQYE